MPDVTFVLKYRRLYACLRAIFLWSPLGQMYYSAQDTLIAKKSLLLTILCVESQVFDMTDFTLFIICTTKYIAYARTILTLVSSLMMMCSNADRTTVNPVKVINHNMFIVAYVPHFNPICYLLFKYLDICAIDQDSHVFTRSSIDQATLWLLGVPVCASFDTISTCCVRIPLIGRSAQHMQIWSALPSMHS